MPSVGAAIVRERRATGTAYVFGPFRLLPVERRLERDGQPVTLGSRALDILIALAEKPGEVLGKNKLLRRVWPDLTVDESSLRFHIAGLRKALGDGTGEQQYIVNIPGRGYCLAAETLSVAADFAPKAEFLREATGLPPVLDRMVGRDEAVLDIVQALGEHRFVTVLGAGGMGKTTIAVAVTHQLLDEYSNNICFVDLGVLTDPSLVASTLATALGIASQSTDPTPEIIDYLRDRRKLIAFDGCEHVVEPVAVLAEQIYLQAPQVRILTTSRERLRVEGEQTIPLHELAHPASDEGLTLGEAMRFPAIRMLVERARAAGYVEVIADAVVPVMVNICKALDGVPLAIELAAGRIAEYGWIETARLLDGRLRLIWQGRRTAPARHQTLHAAIEWSYDLLPSPEQKVFEQLSIFAGPFDLQDAISVATEGGLPATRIASAVQSLVEKSLIAVRGGLATYRLLDTTRAFAREKLDASGARLVVAGRHAAHVLARLEASHTLTSTDFSSVRAQSELGDIYAALHWSFTESSDPQLATRLAAAASRLFIELSLLNECRRWTEAALALGPTHDETIMRLNGGLGYAMMFTQGNGNEAGAALERALALADDLADVASQFHLMVTLLRFRRGRGEYSLLMPMSRRLEDLAASIGDPVAICCAHYQLGTALHLLGHQHAAHAQLEAEIQLDAFDNVPPHHYAYSSHPFIPMSRCLWLLGYPDRALTMARHIAGEGAGTDAVSYCVGLMWVTTVFEATGEWDTVGLLAERLVAYARSHSMRPYQAVGLGLQGRRLLEAGQPKAAVALLRNAIGQARQHGMIMPGFEGSLALALIGAGEIDSARMVVDTAIGRIRSDGESHELPELLRILGEVQVRQGAHAHAVATFDEGMALADCQGALSWKLRLAMSRYRACADRGEDSGSRSILNDVYRQFSEGFDTADLVAARRLLDLSSGVA